ncbi:MAG: manganese catalase family protein [Erysipelotrichales bacterium]|nr:manganese catalase family protein [Erysipelotrichales bacterium]
MELKIDKPYPEIKVENENIYYAQLLQEDYAGPSSETTAIMQYIYQGFDKFQMNPEFSRIISQIAMVEMKHLELLGKTIKALGGKPEFKFVNKKKYIEFWNGSFVDFRTHFKDMLIRDIELEKDAIKSYYKHIKLIDDKYIKVLLKRIIEDELVHLECFNKMLYMISESDEM